jgi:tetratricopeptide (TPR) repeat protein
MGRVLSSAALLFCLAAWSFGQQTDSRQNPPPNQAPPRSDQAPPRSDQGAQNSEDLSPGESSSKSNEVDISPPKDDAKTHPGSGAAVADAQGEDIQEFHPWDPHKAEKDVEVGDFYLKRKNYHAAEDRYREALLYKPNDAIATFRLAQTLEKLGEVDEARANYEGYLKILPEGPLSADAHKALERLQKKESKNRLPEKQ